MAKEGQTGLAGLFHHSHLVCTAASITDINIPISPKLISLHTGQTSLEQNQENPSPQSWECWEGEEVPTQAQGPQG